MKRGLSLVLSLCFLFLLSGISKAEDITDPILKKLVEKGILTEQEAVGIMKDMDKEKAEKEKKAEQKVEQKIEEKVQVASLTPSEGKDLEFIAKQLKGIKFGLLWYLSYMNGEGKDVGGSAGDGVDKNRFAIKRGYFRFTKEFTPWFEAHITTDVTQASIPNSSLSDSIQVRIKYAYGKFKLPDLAFFTKPTIEVGVVHMPWLDFEENLNWYRCQDTMFIERNGIFNSADIGINLVSLFGGLMSEEYQNKVNSAYPGRYGSMSLAVMNGGGYSASEQNQNKVLEGRFTVRPLPDIIPGLQFSYFGTTGKGNTAANPNWTTNIAFGSFESEPVVVTGQYYWGRGQQNGANTTKKDGYSFFTELKLYDMIKNPINRFSVIGRYDHFDPDITKADNENNRYIMGVAYYLDKPHKNMFLLDYDHVDYKASNLKEDHRVQMTLQVAL
jgi:polyhydroxyalkanoate synthesis regulator phasin